VCFARVLVVTLQYGQRRATFPELDCSFKRRCKVFENSVNIHTVSTRWPLQFNAKEVDFGRIVFIVEEMFLAPRILCS